MFSVLWTIIIKIDVDFKFGLDATEKMRELRHLWDQVTKGLWKTNYVAKILKNKGRVFRFWYILKCKGDFFVWDILRHLYVVKYVWSILHDTCNSSRYVSLYINLIIKGLNHSEIWITYRREQDVESHQNKHSKTCVLGFSRKEKTGTTKEKCETQKHTQRRYLVTDT